RGNMFLIENRSPHFSAVRRLPDPSARCAHVVRRRITWDADDGRNTPTAMRPDQPPAHAGIKARIDLLPRLLRGRRRYQRHSNQRHRCKKAINASQVDPPENLRVYHWMGSHSSCAFRRARAIYVTLSKAELFIPVLRSRGDSLSASRTNRPQAE